jgi:hypothetical protein
MSHVLDVYVLIYSLYVVARSRNCPAAARDFGIGQLEHIAEHFGIKEAAVTLTFLRESQPPDRSMETDPWHVYMLLKGHAFNAS